MSLRIVVVLRDQSSMQSFVPNTDIKYNHSLQESHQSKALPWRMASDEDRSMTNSSAVV